MSLKILKMIILHGPNIKKIRPRILPVIGSNKCKRALQKRDYPHIHNLAATTKTKEMIKQCNRIHELQVNNTSLEKLAN